MSLNGRERAEGFNTCCAVAVTVSSQSERAEGFPICSAVTVTASSHTIVSDLMAPHTRRHEVFSSQGK
jgi:hypothetical protein